MLGTRGAEVRKHDRRFAAVVAVLGQPRFQLLHPRRQRGILGHQLGVERFQGRDFLVKRHAPMLCLQRKSVCIDPITSNKRTK